MKLLLITWPSWSWKTTLQNKLIEDYSWKYRKIILATCREKRKNENWELIEHNWIDYNFLDKDSFIKKDLIFKFWNYWISKEDWNLWENNTNINIIACWFLVANFFFNLWLKNLGIIFMNTDYDECYNRMIKQRWNNIEVIERMKIFESESQTKNISKIIVNKDYLISDINNKIQEILK